MEISKYPTARIVRIVIVLWTMTFLCGCTAVPKRSVPSPGPAPSPTGEKGTSLSPLSAAGTSGSRIAEVAERISPAVVGISTLSIQQRPDLDVQRQLVEGVGTGVVIHSSGYILTNDHVAGGNTRSMSVIFNDGRKMKGTTLWSDPTLDLAVVKVEGSNITAAPLGSSADVKVGDTAIAIGTPLGLQFKHTVTSGIISALNRTLQVPTERGENFMEDLIQTDASINPGNSGGPLLNDRGEVVGINTLKIEAAEGIGFAIPIDVAKPIIGHFIREGKFETPYIGIFAIDREIAGFYEDGLELKEGVYVISIDENGPAYQSGLRKGDVITRVDGQKTDTMLDLRKAIYGRSIGSKVSIIAFRNGKQKTLEMSLKKKPI